jgi:putative membrane protein insertion efficiency factor
MSGLRQSLKRPETYLFFVGISLLALALETFRSPESQLTGQFYIGGVHLYQALGRPLLKGRIECRYRPTCSEYSIEAVRQYGLRHGIALTVHRIESCTTDVKPGTFDPVPAPGHRRPAAGDSSLRTGAPRASEVSDLKPTRSAPREKSGSVVQIYPKSDV